MEGLAGAGQILVSPETAAMLPRSCLGAQLGTGVLLARSPAGAEWAAAEEGTMPSEQAIAACLPAMVRPHLLGGHAAPEHRTASVAFLQFTGLDRMIADRGAEDVAGRLDELVRVVQDASDRYEVCFLDSDISADGGKIRLSAGAPRAVGDDEERMLLALRQIIEADPPLPVQAGVNRGPVFTGEVGPDYRRWYAVMGDTVNLAARVMGKAPAGRLYATRDVLRHARVRFSQTEVGPFKVKGKARPVQAWDVGSPMRSAGDAGRPTRAAAGRPRSELERLDAAIADARRGAGSVLELVGETGSGKSRLLAEARKLGEGMAVLRSTCEVVTRETPYFAWRELLRQLLGVEWDDPAERVRERLEAEVRDNHPELLPWLALIAIVVDVEVPASTEVGPARARRPRREAARGRAAVPGTGAGRADDRRGRARPFDGRGVRRPVRGAGAGARVLVLDRARRPVRTRPAARRCRAGRRPGSSWGPLPAEDVRTLALSTPEAAQVPPHVVELAVERSGGSPEFLLDLLAAAAAGDRDELPESVGAATMARIDALDPPDRAVVRRAAVLGINFHPRRLADVLAADEALPEDGFWDRLSGVFAREADGHVRFKRPAIQEVAYASLPFKLRRELHLAVGLRLEHGRRARARRRSRRAVATTSRWPATTRAPTGTRWRPPSAPPSASRTPTRRGCIGGRSRPGGRSGLAADARSLADAWEQLGEALRAWASRRRPAGR